jgi:hypothetical protein
MALQHVESTPTGAVAMYGLKEVLKAAGWDVMSSSDGTTYNASGDQITSGAAGAGGMANSQAWFRIRSPDGVFEYVVQRGTTNLVWRIMMNRNVAPFTGGSPGATQTPSSTSEALLWGSGSHASPGFTQMFTTDSTYRFKACADDAAPYGWWCCSFLIGGGTTGHLLWHDPLVATAPGDSCPFLSGALGNGYGGVDLQMSQDSASMGIRVMYSTVPAVGLGTLQQFGAFYPVNAAGSNFKDHKLAQNPITLADDLVPALYMRTAQIANSCWKGVGTVVKWNSTVKSIGSIADMGDGTYRMTLSAVNMPWPNDAVLI